MQTKFKKYFQARDQKEKASHLLLNLKGSILLLACLALLSFMLQPQTQVAEPVATSIAELGGGKSLRVTLQNNKFIEINKTAYSANQFPKKLNQVTLSTEIG